MSARERLAFYVGYEQGEDDAHFEAHLDQFAAEVRAEVLNEAADLIEAEQHRLDDEENAKHGWLDHDSELQHVAVHAMGALLRRAATSPAAVPVPDETAGDETGEVELAELREVKRRVTEQLEDFEEGLEEDPGAPAVAHNMTQLLARAVRGDR